MDQVQAGEQKNNEDLNSTSGQSSMCGAICQHFGRASSASGNYWAKDYYPLSSSSCQNESNDK
jgi:hypothetical protein